MKLTEIMGFMADNNLDISRSDIFLSAKTVKQGAEITMGTDQKTMINISTEKYIPVLFCINRQQYELLLKGVTDLDILKSK